jgi:hypothetical protein
MSAGAAVVVPHDAATENPSNAQNGVTQQNGATQRGRIGDSIGRSPNSSSFR